MMGYSLDSTDISYLNSVAHNKNVPVELQRYADARATWRFRAEAGFRVEALQAEIDMEAEYHNLPTHLKWKG